VTKDVPANTVVGGIPAKIIKTIHQTVPDEASGQQRMKKPLTTETQRHREKAKERKEA
jgi:serine acetyltransferase